MRSNSVHVGGTLLGESFVVENFFSSFGHKLHLSNELVLLELKEAVSDAFTSGKSGVFGSGSISVFTGVMLSEGVDTNLTSHVELISDGGSSDVKPVLIVRSEILVAGGFVINGPFWHSDLVTLLEVLGESFDEFLSWHVFDGAFLLAVDNDWLK